MQQFAGVTDGAGELRSLVVEQRVDRVSDCLFRTVVMLSQLTS